MSGKMIVGIKGRTPVTAVTLDNAAMMDHLQDAKAVDRAFVVPCMEQTDAVTPDPELMFVAVYGGTIFSYGEAETINRMAAEIGLTTYNLLSVPRKVLETP